MAIENKTPFGEIKISKEAVASVVGETIKECYGVLGLASREGVRATINNLLGATEYIKGIYCRNKKDKDRKDSYEIDVYIVVAYGVKITEVVTGVQQRLSYELKKVFGTSFEDINVFVQDIKKI